MLIEHYALIKTLHISLALLSGVVFVLRGLWVLLSAVALPRVLHRVSYAVDSALLLAALLLLAGLSFTPLAAAWLQAKLLLLLVYIACGAVVFRVQYPIAVRWLACCAALLCYAGVYYSARMHQPFAGILSGF